MIRKEPTRRGDKVKVTFILPDDGSSSDVFVAGDFNAWSPGATPLRRKDGHRTASVMLVAGRRYAFRYYQGGRWFTDEDADGYAPNEFGEQNGILDLTVCPEAADD
jgi:hypothetical protein